MRLGGVDAALETKPTQLNLHNFRQSCATTSGTTKSTPPLEHLSRRQRRTRLTPFMPHTILSDLATSWVLPHYSPREWRRFCAEVEVIRISVYITTSPAQSFAFPVVLLMRYCIFSFFFYLLLCSCIFLRHPFFNLESDKLLSSFLSKKDQVVILVNSLNGSQKHL